MIRYVDSSGWTWEVCEVARDLESGDGSPPASDPPARAAAPRPRERERRAPFADGPADLRPIRRADRDGEPTGHEAGSFAADAALYFLSRLGTRKLRHYPPGWDELPRTELEALCWSAEIV